MEALLFRVERAVDRAIPLALVALLAILAAEFLYQDVAEQYRFWVEAGDAFVVIVFLLDLAFKYRRVGEPNRFVRKYWLDMLAVFPFYVAFRFAEVAARFVRLEAYIPRIQELLHGGVGAERITAELSRSERFARWLRPILRSPRLFKISGIFGEPHKKGIKHHRA